MSHIYDNFAKKIWQVLQKTVLKPTGDIHNALERVVVEPSKDESHGQLATNIAMVMAKFYTIPPIELAQILKPLIQAMPEVEWVQVASPGFINIKLNAMVWAHELKSIVESQKLQILYNCGQGQKINIEYVSNNPTGPMHVGHCRGAVVGDVLANILLRTGYDVVKEFYINDAGNQIDNLAHALYQRYRENLGYTVSADITYKGDYLIELAQALVSTVGKYYLDSDEQVWLPFFKSYAIEHMMKAIRHDLNSLNIHHDVFTSEAELLKAGAIDAAIDQLKQRDLIYTGVLEKPKGKEIEDWEPREQLLFRATDFGDEVDRPLQKSDQTWTYFACDIAYHYQKFKCGASTLINIWGADHGGYVKRITAALKAVTENQADVKCVIVQMVKFIENGQSLKMSKRAGTFITVDHAINKVGLDVLRFIMLTRKADTPLDFDFDKVVEQTRDNPVFYAQYAYARCFSIKRHINSLFPQLILNDTNLASHDLLPLINQSFLPLIQKLVQWSRVLEQAAKMLEPHRITYYILEVASLFHNLWTQGRDNTHLKFIIPEDPNMTQLHYTLIHALIKTMQQGFEILGVTPLEEM